MSGEADEATIVERVEQRPGINVETIRDLSARELAYRFAAGALTSVAAAALTLALGARVGGIMLAFPAILGASLTLIAEEEDRGEAREDARGAVAGGLAMALFAGVAALTLGHVSGAVALLLATAAWFVGAFALYGLAWYR
jgi:hypothetical protein